MNQVRPNRFWDLDDRMTIVLFAGMGGGCDGLEDAGYPVHVAINHDPVAVAVHKKRHPHTQHLQSDVFEADPREVTKGRGVRALHASPDCTHFSVAKGSKPVSKRRRSLAWVICRWLGTVRPEVVTLENVREITTWGGLIAKRDKVTGRVLKLDGTVAAKGERVPVEQQWLVPDPKKKGRIWRAFKKHVAGLGYSFDYRVLCCADFGVKTIRTRLFGVMRADGGPIVWRPASHAQRKKAKAAGLEPWLGAHTIIDWSRPVKSIFGRKKPLAEATLRRIARGVMRYVVDAQEPFIVPICQTGSTTPGRPVGDPLATVTTARGGELSLVAPHVTKFRNGSVGSSMDEPLPTVTANSFEKRPGGAIPLGVAAATLVRTDQASAAGRNGVHDPREPINTLHTANGMAIVSATLVGAGGRAAQTEPRSVEDPLSTSSTKEDRILVEAELAPFVFDSAHGEGQGRGESEWSPEEPLRTVQASPGKGVAVASLIQTGYGERAGQAPRVLDIREPLGTQVDGSKAALVAAFLAQHNTGEPGRPAEEPLSTIVSRGSTQGVVAAALGEMRGSSMDGRDATEPLAAVTANGGHAHLILAFLQRYYGQGGQDQDLNDPLTALTSKARHGLVTVHVHGVEHYIDDIGIRMLEPEEGAAAHGFVPEALPAEIEIDGKVRRLTKTEKYHLVGNSVPPFMVQMLAEDNCRRELMVAAE